MVQTHRRLRLQADDGALGAAAVDGAQNPVRALPVLQVLRVGGTVQVFRVLELVLLPAGFEERQIMSWLADFTVLLNFFDSVSNACMLVVG